MLREVPLPGGGTRRDQYDFAGRLLTQDFPDGSWLRYDYGPDRQLRAVVHSSGARVDYEVDLERRRWTARTDRTETVIEVSEDGAPAALETRIDGRSWRVAYRRDAEGRLAAVRYPGSRDWLELRRAPDSALTAACDGREYCRLHPGDERGETVCELANGARTVERTSRGRRPRLERITVRAGSGEVVADLAYETGEDGRLVRVGPARVAYHRDRLREVASDEGSWRYAYDEADRLDAAESPAGRRRFGYRDGAPMVAAIEGADGAVRFEYDRLGRRVARHGPGGTTRYGYDLFGQLATVELPDGRRIDYLYDGFGRLVGRTAEGRTTFYVVGLDGHRLAAAGADGAIEESYLWLDAQCVGRIRGAMGGPLTATFHRLHGGRLAAVGDEGGRLRPVRAADPFGSDWPVEEGIPGYAGLFGDPETGLLWAGSRWLDPASTQFLTPDSWAGEDPGRHLPAPLRRVLRALPGGLGRVIPARDAYSWCACDPINFSDPHGHNWLGLIWSIISALLWESQLTSLAWQMEILNFVIDLAQVLILRPVWDTDGYWKWSFYNLAAPTASYRKMVPLTLWLNGYLKIHENRAWTLGSIVWERGSDLRDIESRARRDLLVCANAGTYRSFTDPGAGQRLRVRNPAVAATGTVNAAGTRITGLAVTAPAGATLGDLFETRDGIAIRPTAGGRDEIRTITAVAASSFNLSAAPLPSALRGQAVNVVRLDVAAVKAAREHDVAARQVSMVKGTSVHPDSGFPDGFPTTGLTVTEYLLAADRKRQLVTDFPVEMVILRLARAADLTGFAAAQEIRIQSGGVYFARRLRATHPSRDLQIEEPLPTRVYTNVRVARLTAAGSAEAGQSATTGPAPASRPRISFGTRTDLQRHEGLEIQGTGAAAAELRIATAFLLELTLDPLPAALHATAVAVDLMDVDGAAETTGKTKAAGTVVETVAGQATRFRAGQPVRVTRTSNGKHGFGVVSAVAAATNRITLAEALPAADFPNDTDVRVRSMRGTRSFAAEPAAAPGSRILVSVQAPNDLRNGQIVRVRPTGATDGGALRKIQADPTLIVELDTALSGPTAAGLTVRRLQVGAPARTGVSVPTVRQRLVAPGVANPYVSGDTLYLRGFDPAPPHTYRVAKQTCLEVDRIAGQDVFARRPVEGDLAGVHFEVVALQATGTTTAGAELGQGRVLVPAELGEEPLTRREALEHHEMRHVWQGAVWGPMLLSLPIPWLINLGFSFSDIANSGSTVMRHIGVGGLDSLFALLVWGIGGAESPIHLTGSLGADRKTVQFAADADAARVEPFADGRRVEVSKEGFDTFNVVEKLTAGERKVELRFALEEGRFAPGDNVKLTMSPFEQIRKTVSDVTNLSFERIWHDHIPSAWGRALSSILTHDAWFPLGLYPLSLIAARGKEKRLPNEQDAAYHSGDLYTPFPMGESATAFTGQFVRVFAFQQARHKPLDEPFERLTVELSSAVAAAATAAGMEITDVLPGTSALTATTASFREDRYIPLHERVDNAVGVFFSASLPGQYQFKVPGMLTQNIVFKFAFDVDFVERTKITINHPTMVPDPGAPGFEVFETEVVDFKITGDPAASYVLRFPPGAAATRGTIAGRRYTAPDLGGAASANQDLEVTATYQPNAPVFRGAGQQGNIRLAGAQLTNLARRFPVPIRQIAAPARQVVAAGRSVTFNMPIAPQSVRVTSPRPAGATVHARVVIGTGRPATLTFFAPDAVSAATDVTFEMTFGANPAHRKTVVGTFGVTP